MTMPSCSTPSAFILRHMAFARSWIFCLVNPSPMTALQPPVPNVSQKPPPSLHPMITLISCSVPGAKPESSPLVLRPQNLLNALLTCSGLVTVMWYVTPLHFRTAAIRPIPLNAGIYAKSDSIPGRIPSIYLVAENMPIRRFRSCRMPCPSKGCMLFSHNELAVGIRLCLPYFDDIVLAIGTKRLIKLHCPVPLPRRHSAAHTRDSDG